MWRWRVSDDKDDTGAAIDAKRSFRPGYRPRHDADCGFVGFSRGLGAFKCEEPLRHVCEAACAEAD